MTATAERRTLTGGVVAFNERSRIRDAIRSLTLQALPKGIAWGEIVVVVSGSTDGTERVVREVAQSDPRIRLVVESHRSGKAAALRQVFRRAHGDYLILLNGDAIAEEGAVAELVRAAGSEHGRFAVMGRPLPGRTRTDPFARTVDLLWAIHHTEHARAIATHSGNHLSDELLLLPVDALPPLESGIVNDGSFIGAWLSSTGGNLLYAPDAVVRITVPTTFRELVRQRRRIRYGHGQIGDRLGTHPTTLERYARAHPLAAMRLVARETRHPGGVRAFATLLAVEALALGLAAVDRGSARTDHVRWRPIAGASPDPAPGPVGVRWPPDGA